MKFSIVVPVKDEEGSVEELHQQIVDVMNGLGESYEIIFIDDGSVDATFERLSALSPVTIIQLRRNYGQTAALDAGFKAAKGEYVVTMDGDLQNDPQDIPVLVAKLESDGGYDVVSGWRHERKDRAGKRFASRGANMLRKFFADDGIHDSGCTLKIYRREALHHLDLYGEMHRFIPAILKWRGFRIGEEKVRHHARKTGKTKYNWKRIVKGLVDMFSVWFWRKYANRPLHLFGGLGFLSILAGFILGFTLLILRLFFAVSLSDRIWPLVAVFFVLVGVQLFVSGLLADIAVKTYYGKQESYHIRTVISKS
jgi:glycosyltransferase involved in cell wall biosynthesis